MCYVTRSNFFSLYFQGKKSNPPGLEPGIFRSVGGRVIHCATDPYKPYLVTNLYLNVRFLSISGLEFKLFLIIWCRTHTLIDFPCMQNHIQFNYMHNAARSGLYKFSCTSEASSEVASPLPFGRRMFLPVMTLWSSCAARYCQSTRLSYPPNIFAVNSDGDSIWTFQENEIWSQLSWFTTMK